MRDKMRNQFQQMFVLFLAVLSFIPVEAKAATENNIQCWNVQDYISKGNISPEKILQLQEVQEVINKVGSIPNIIPPLVICETKIVNAWVTTTGNPLVMTTGILDLLGSDKNMIAALAGHEISHLVLNHTKQKNELDSVFRRDGEKVGRRVINNGGSFNDANNITNLVYLAKTKAFSRELESEADDLGIQYASKSGYDPEGVRSLFNLMVEKGAGKIATDFFDDHPGFFERYVKSGGRVLDEHFDQMASRYLINNEWTNLETGVNQWMSKFPYSPNAWFYNAKVQGRVSKNRELEALENAFTYSTPSLSKRQVQIDESFLTLCIDLYSQGYALESAICSKGLSKPELKEQFNKQTFRGILVDLGNPPPAINLVFVKEKDGSKLITDRGWAENQAYVDTPAWKPIRFTPKIVESNE